MKTRVQVILIALVLLLTAQHVAAFTIQIDARTLSSTGFLIVGKTGLLDGTTVQKFDLTPGTYSLQPGSGSVMACSFSVTAEGRIDFEGACNSFLWGRGTDTLVVRGHTIKIDARALSSTGFLVPNAFGLDRLMASTEVHPLTLVPFSAYVFQVGSGAVGNFSWGIDQTGRITYDSAFDSFLSGRGTDTLVVRGHSIKIDARALSSTGFLVPNAFGLADHMMPSTEMRSLTLVPLNAYVFQVGAGLLADFSWGIDQAGRITYDPAFDSFLSGRGTDTLVVRGHTIKLDARALRSAGFLLPNAFGLDRIMPSTEVHRLTLVPVGGSYVFRSGVDNATFEWNLDYEGHITFAPGFAGSIAGLGTDTLLVNRRICASHVVTGFILDEWISRGGSDSVLGCPINDEQDVSGTKGRLAEFERGQIAWSPKTEDLSDRFIQVVYQLGTIAFFEWGDTSPFSYDRFLVRWEKMDESDCPYEYDADARSCQVAVSSTPTRGKLRFALPNNKDNEGNYRIVVEGCDTPVIGPSHCRQGWSNPIVIHYSPYQIDLSQIPSATNPEEANQRFQDRAIEVSNYNACQGKTLGDVFLDEQDFMVVAIAKLHIAENRGKDWRCPGSNVSVSDEVNEALLRQEIKSKSGSSASTYILNVPVCVRTGEYDVALKGYITILGRFSGLLTPQVQGHVLELLNKRGSHDPDDESYCGINETENHLLMIETSRYLTNQILFDKTRLPGFNNEQNGMNEYMLRQLQQFLSNDFIEYNARPYQTYSMMALQNLYDFALDQRVKTAAQMVLDYVSAKFAASSNSLRRTPGYRRRASHYSTNLLNNNSDSQTNRFLLYTGMSQMWNEVEPKNHAHWGARDDMQLAAVTTYRPPDLILELIMNPDHRHFYQRIHHNGVELYSSERDFLISAGGFWMGSPYRVLGSMEDKDDQGVVLPTVLMPTDRYHDVKDFIQIGGFKEVTDSDGKPERERINTCVALGFACGIDPIVPELYLPKDNPACWHREGSWTFVDYSTQTCNPSEFGFYAAVYGVSGGGYNYGFFEARGRSDNSHLTFEQFWHGVLDKNQGKTFSDTDINTYTTSADREIKFRISPPGSNKYEWGIVAVDGKQFESDISKWPLAEGDIIKSDGHSGLVIVENPFVRKRLILDMRDPLNPKRTEEAQ